MKRLSLLLLAALPFLTTSAQMQIKVSKNDGSTTTINSFDWIELDDSTQSIKIHADSVTTLPMNQLERISFGRDYLPWNLSWKSIGHDAHYMYGYSAIMHIRDFLTEDMTVSGNTPYDSFSSWSTNRYRGKNYVTTQYVWGYMRDLIMESNQWIAACKDKSSQKGLLGVAYASRALLYLDLARMYEFLPNDRTSSVSVSGKDITGLTVPIITEETSIDDLTYYYYAPRATRQEMSEFILNDLNLAENLLPNLDIESNLLPHLDAVYGLKARLYLWVGDYTKAQQYARRAIDASTTKPMTRDEMLSATKGFNDPTCWMWGVKYNPEDDGVMSSIVNWTSMISNQTTFGYTGPSTNMFVQISKKMYECISDYDIRKLWWIAPSGSPLNEQIPSVVSEDYGPLNQYLTPYTSVKFRPAEGNADNYAIGNVSAFPLMRVEEMYFIEAEAAAQQGMIQQAQQLLKLFMLQYRNPSYDYTATSQQNIIDEIILQKRVELWGEGQTFFDVKRLNMSVTRDYEDTNVPQDRRFNTQGRPAWMNLVFPSTEERYNEALNEENNPDPSDVYQDTYQSLNEDILCESIHGNVMLDTPKFVDKIEILPLDSVEQIRFRYTLPKSESGVSFETQLQVSLSPRFPSEYTKFLYSTTGDSETGDINVWCTTLSRTLAWLLKQQGKATSGEPYIYLRVISYVAGLPAIQYTSNIVSFRVSVSENPSYLQGYSYAPKLTASSADVLDMERLAGQENVKVCSLDMNGEGSVYNTYSSEFPYRINLNLWGLGFDINKDGIVNTDNLYEDPFVSLYKHNWGEYFTGHPAEYPGLQHYQADVTCKADRDDLIFSLRSNPLDVSVIINRQAWEEYDYSWRDRYITVMRSEMMPNNTHVELEKAADSDVYRLRAPYGTGHNIMLSVNGDNSVTMSRQYAYNDTWGQPVYASGKGTFDGWTFDMQVTFCNADYTQSIVRHEIYGEKPEWNMVYEGIFYSNLFGSEIEGAIYRLSTNPEQYKLVPFIWSDEGLEFTWSSQDNSISFEDQSTGYNHPTYGMIIAQNYPGSYVEYVNGLPTFHFSIRYYVDAGSFGTYDEVFTVTQTKSTRAPKKQKSLQLPKNMWLIPNGLKQAE